MLSALVLFILSFHISSSLSLPGSGSYKSDVTENFVYFSVFLVAPISRCLGLFFLFRFLILFNFILSRLRHLSVNEAKLQAYCFNLIRSTKPTCIYPPGIYGWKHMAYFSFYLLFLLSYVDTENHLIKLSFTPFSFVCYMVEVGFPRKNEGGLG